ncbi:MAG: IS110 family transposase [Alphaproteobacteria bacterium]|nr:IS110 family transposase [Alphaproteobacteria bacterium]
MVLNAGSTSRSPRFCEAAALERGSLIRLGRIEMRRDRLGAFARSLTHDDHVVIEATGNAAAVAEVLRPHVGRAVIANPQQVRLIAHAKIKTDRIDASVLARLYASGFLPEVWIPDERTQALRRQVTRRNQLVRQRTRLKNIVQSILHSHLIPPCPTAALFGPKGRAWLAEQNVPADERFAVERHVREYDRLGDDLSAVERDLARNALADEHAKRLITIPGIHMVVAVGVMAAIGSIERFASPQQLVSYFGLNPSVRQSGTGPVHRGRITKRGRGHARGMLVEAAWVAARVPGPLRAFFLRIRARRGPHVAAVATARKLAFLIWHMLRRREDYAWMRPALHARKIRDVELSAGHPARRGQRGAAYAYNLSTARQRERRRVEQAEKAYQRLVQGWTQHGPKVRIGAAKEERR